MLRQRKGFTLMEMIVVVAILGIMVLFAVPSFMRIFWERGRTSMNELAQEMRTYRERALATGVDYIVEFQPATGSYRLHKMTTPPQIVGPFEIKSPTRYGGGTAGGQVPEGAGPIPVDGVSIIGGGLMLTFSRYGGATGGAVYFNDTRNSYAIGIWRTGRVKTWRWTGGVGGQWY